MDAMAAQSEGRLGAEASAKGSASGSYLRLVDAEWREGDAFAPDMRTMPSRLVLADEIDTKDPGWQKSSPRGSSQKSSLETPTQQWSTSRTPTSSTARVWWPSTFKAPTLNSTGDMMDIHEAKGTSFSTPARTLSRLDNNEARTLSRLAHEGKLHCGELLATLSGLLSRLSAVLSSVRHSKLTLPLLAGAASLALAVGLIWLCVVRLRSPGAIVLLPGQSLQDMEFEDRLGAPAIPRDGDQQEWMVLSEVQVHSGPHWGTEILEVRKGGSVAVGAREGEWVKLRGSGYIPVSDGDPSKPDLKVRHVMYQIANVTECSAVGRQPIRHQVTCDAAAAALRYGLHFIEGYGCFAKKRSPMGGVRLRRLAASAASGGRRAPYETGGNTTGEHVVRPVCSNATDVAGALADTTTATATTTVVTPTTTATATTTTNTVTRLRPWGFPSLFCWSTMEAGYEAELLKAQLAKRTGIFDCDDFAVVSVAIESFGQGPYGEVKSIPIALARKKEPYGRLRRRLSRLGGAAASPSVLRALYAADRAARRALPQLTTEDAQAGDGRLANTVGLTQPNGGVDDTAFFGPKELPGDSRTISFITAWEAIRIDGRFRAHDWVVKADADTVFLPERLRPQLLPYTANSLRRGDQIFLTNCNREAGPNWPRMLGTIEVISHQALEVYYGSTVRCWSGWKEDDYMSHCLNLLGARSVDDIRVLSDQRCSPTGEAADCTDVRASAFSSFKKVDTWLSCWTQTAMSQGA